MLELDKVINIKGKDLRDGGRRIIIYLDPETYEKAKRVAYSRGFSSVDRLIESYVREWISYDLTYLGDE